MTATDFVAILPFLVLAGTATTVMLVIAFNRSHRLTAVLSLVGIALSLVALIPTWSVAPRQVTPLFVLDGYAVFYTGMVLAASLGVLLLAYGYLDGRRGPQEEWYLLVLLAALGAMSLVASDQFASFFVSLETLSVALLGLIAYPRDRRRPVEAGIKYLILAGTSSAFLLFGMALIYAKLGSMEFARIATLLHVTRDSSPDLYWLTGFAMIMTGFGFKLSLVPFHMWAPDVYEGAPAPVTAFVAVVSKGAVFALLLRYFLMTGAYRFGSVMFMINVIAILSIIVGNLLALLQNNVKRILAYSSIAHLGYLLVALLVGGALAVEAVTYYLVAYFVMTLGAFGVVTVLSASGMQDDLDDLNDYRGLLWRRPWLGGAFTVMLLSLAGIPLTVGFIAKFYAVAAGVGADLWPAVFALVVGSVIGLFYYLRVIVVMLEAVPVEMRSEAGVVPWSGGATITVLTLVLIWLGVYPAPLIQLIRMVTLHVGTGSSL
jgi:NADH-quinone oxidoreductase subunit N